MNQCLKIQPDGTSGRLHRPIFCCDSVGIDYCRTIANHPDSRSRPQNLWHFKEVRNWHIVPGELVWCCASAIDGGSGDEPLTTGCTALLAPRDAIPNVLYTAILTIKCREVNSLLLTHLDLSFKRFVEILTVDCLRPKCARELSWTVPFSTIR